MRSRIVFLVGVCALLAAGLVFVGCGSSDGEELLVAEGEQLDLDGLIYNVAITRFLNPDDTEDAEYLVGQDPPEPGTSYLGVFLTIRNHSDEPLRSSYDYLVASSGEGEYFPLQSESPYALPIGDDVPPLSKFPIPNSTPATGPIEGSMLLFLVDDSISESRPLRLEIGGEDEVSEIELDI